MLMTIQTLLTDYLAEIQKIYGLHLKSVILYGSYARGDYTPESDVDIMILVDLPDDEISMCATGIPMIVMRMWEHIKNHFCRKGNWQMVSFAISEF